MDKNIDIPDKLYFDISEVSDLTGIKPYVLRYWETEFPILKPTKTSRGQRKYKKKDIEVILEIQDLLYAQKFTITGAKKQLGKKQVVSSRKKDIFTVLEDTKEELKALRDLLSRPVGDK